MTDQRQEGSDRSVRPAAGARPNREDAGVLPQTTRDEQDEGWGERPADLDHDREEFLRQERPPHHDR